MTAPALVYLLCLVTCVLCAGLLVRAWLKTRIRLMMWTATGFVFLAFNNLFLFCDVVLFPNIDFSIPRFTASLLAVATMIVGFIWEAE